MPLSWSVFHYHNKIPEAGLLMKKSLFNSQFECQRSKEHSTGSGKVPSWVDHMLGVKERAGKSWSYSLTTNPSQELPGVLILSKGSAMESASASDLMSSC